MATDKRPRNPRSLLIINQHFMYYDIGTKLAIFAYACAMIYVAYRVNKQINLKTNTNHYEKIKRQNV